MVQGLNTWFIYSTKCFKVIVNASLFIRIVYVTLELHGNSNSVTVQKQCYISIKQAMASAAECTEEPKVLIIFINQPLLLALYYPAIG